MAGGTFIIYIAAIFTREPGPRAITGVGIKPRGTRASILAGIIVAIIGELGAILPSISDGAGAGISDTHIGAGSTILTGLKSYAQGHVAIKARGSRWT